MKKAVTMCGCILWMDYVSSIYWWKSFGHILRLFLLWLFVGLSPEFFGCKDQSWISFLSLILYQQGTIMWVFVLLPISACIHMPSQSATVLSLHSGTHNAAYCLCSSSYLLSSSAPQNVYISLLFSPCMHKHGGPYDLCSCVPSPFLSSAQKAKTHALYSFPSQKKEQR